MSLRVDKIGASLPGADNAESSTKSTKNIDIDFKNSGGSADSTEQFKELEAMEKSYNKFVKNADKMVKSLNKQGYDISSEDKEAIKKKKQEIDTAFETRTPEEVEELIAELDELVQEAIVRASNKPFEDAADICKNIAAAAEGIDWNSSQEKVIKEEVSKINSKNVVAVFDQWSRNDYNSITGDKGGMMQTIFGEFKAQPKEKQELAEHILDALEEAAKEQGKTEEIARQVAVIKGQIKDAGLLHIWDYGKIYNAFNTIHAILGNP